MFDIGGLELLVIGVVALIVVGPKDLPGMFRTVGRMTGKAKAMARDFQRAMSDAADDTGMKDMNTDLRKIMNPKSMGIDAVKDATKDWVAPHLKESPNAAPGTETAKLAEERRIAAEKIRQRTAEAALARQTAAAEAQENADSEAATQTAETTPAEVAPADTTSPSTEEKSV
ncbi:Sec-independent protein translocase protein TatB [Cochlodiniinecator piscidefendens]|uniref:Sec-independent protein translocase protein TatB n=1 Tax=Cochlodiniinecator piscidefendens TaxID=2715756 RepID=UPI00140D8054|nr:Sec-independent protein translocase protein TatB [Cochlodiniinecator piscidefendens]